MIFKNGTNQKIEQFKQKLGLKGDVYILDNRKELLMKKNKGCLEKSKQDYNKNKKMIILLSILNLFDYILTLLNRGNFEEANPLTRPIIDNTLALTILKLIIVPIFIYVLWRFKDKPIVKIATVVLCLVYLYAVTLGVLIYASG